MTPADRSVNAWLTTRESTCSAASPDGWQCEGGAGHHHAEHYAGGGVDETGKVFGDVVWTGTSRPMERRCLIHGFLMEFSMMSTRELAEALSMSESTVRRHCRALEAEGLIQYSAGWQQWEAL